MEARSANPPNQRSKAMKTYRNGKIAAVLLTLMTLLSPASQASATLRQERDKTGTTGYHFKCQGAEVDSRSVLGRLSSFQAERQGFEPWVPLRAHWFSRPAQSATLSPLRGDWLGESYSAIWFASSRFDCPWQRSAGRGKGLISAATGC